ncbi:WGR domain-containing protein [Rhizobium sophoriradicis]|uniref:WGR domain-containing protein n=1 Tax=Rhizobium sophoriradicis TaxID=1535245 RepID=UPI0017D31920
MDADPALSDSLCHNSHHYQLYAERTDAKKNMAHYYAMSIEHNLFGEACTIRRWVVSAGKVKRREHHFAREEEAVKALPSASAKETVDTDEAAYSTRLDRVPIAKGLPWRRMP